MANANTPFGLWPVRDTTGRVWTGASNIYYVASTLGTGVFLGDPLIPTGTSDANGIPGVTLATAGATNYLIGPMVGIVSAGEPLVSVTRDMPIYRPASTAQYILVADDPNLLFKGQEDGDGGVMSVNDSMTNVDLISGTGSTVTGYSGWLLDSSTAGTGATLQCRLIRPWNAPDNTVGTGTTRGKWLFRINLHSLSNTTGI